MNFYFDVFFPSKAHKPQKLDASLKKFQVLRIFALSIKIQKFGHDFYFDVCFSIKSAQIPKIKCKV